MTIMDIVVVVVVIDVVMIMVAIFLGIGVVIATTLRILRKLQLTRSGEIVEKYKRSEEVHRMTTFPRGKARVK